MAEGEKPYRIYRGGRVKGRVPTLPKPERGPRRDGQRPPRLRYPGPGPKEKERWWRRWSWRRRILLGVVLLFLLLVVWLVMSYLAIRSGAKDANARLSPAARTALEPQDGLVLSHPSVFLLLGTDHAAYQRQRRGFRRSDSIMLVRTDPGRGRISYLSIPRDLRVEVPGYGFERINSAMQLGGAPLAIRTVRQFVAEVNHVVVVNFDAFKEVIDKVGGVTVDVPGPILANKFDCPYPTQARCDRWSGWRFRKGPQTMDGKRALVYSRIRENKLNPRETDFTRGERQQAVIQALLSKLTSMSVFVKLPFVGDDVMRPLTTDLSAGQLIQLALVKKRSSHELHCRLGGEPQNFGGGSFIQLDEEARRTVLAFQGKSAPQPPLPGSTYGSGCP
jgi:LCP family protein required for cell wall assembly